MPNGLNDGTTPQEPGDWDLVLMVSMKRCLCCQDLILAKLYAYQTYREQGRNYLCFDCWNQYDSMWPVPIYGLPRYKEDKNAIQTS